MPETSTPKSPEALAADLNLREHRAEILALPEAQHQDGDTYTCPACQQQFSAPPVRFARGANPVKCPHCKTTSRR